MATEFISNSWLMPTNANAEANRVSNYSLDFDGSSQYIDCGAISSIPSATELSISFWANTNSTSQNQVVFGDNSATPIFSFEYWGSANRMYFEYGTSLYAYLTLTDVVTAGSWHNVVLVYNASGAGNTDKIKIYVDGVDKSSLLTYNGTIPTSLNASIGDFWIGNGQNYNSPFNGKMTEVSIFDYALSASQITELYGTGSAIGNPMAITNGRKPINYYPLGNAAFNGEFLTPNGAEQDYVFDFDGNDKINTNTLTNFGITNEFTISTWIKPSSLSNYGLVLVATSGGGWTDGMGIYYLSNKWHFFVDHYSSGDVISTTTATTDVWYHIVGTFSSSGTVKLYINGVEEGTPVTGITLDGLSETLVIGSVSIDGLYSNTQIWNKELIASEITTLYNYGTPYTGTQPQSANLKGWWELDASATFDGSNWSIPDASSNSNTGTSSGMTAANLVQSDLIINAPFDSFSLSFDGVDERISFTETNLGLNNSISIWFKRPSTGANVLLGQGSAWYDYAVRIESNGSIKYADRYTSPTLTFDNASTKLIVNNTNTWVNIVIVRTGSTANLYVNGVDYDGSKSWGSGSEEGTVFNRLATAGDGSSFGFNGQLSNFASWNTSLTSAQALEVYNEAKPSNLNNHSASSSLVSWYRLGAVNTFYNSTTTEFTVLDEVGTNNGTSVNMEQGDLVSGVGATGSGTSSGMGSGENRIGSAPFSENNAVSYNLSVLAKSTSTPT